MLFYIARRVAFMVLTLVIISIIAFMIIQIPPGDYLTTYIQRLAMTGQSVQESQLAALRLQYGLDLPVYRQYFKWIFGIFRGNWGRSFQWGRPVRVLLQERLGYTLLINLSSLMFIYLVAIPIGVYSATHRYSFGDYTLSVFGFIGLATPPFLLALLIMVFLFKFAGIHVGGLVSPEFASAPFSFAKFVDILKHLPVPIALIGLSGTAGLIRVMRGCLLDELKKQYVVTARSKGVSEQKLLFRYPVRVAINPIISTVGWLLPATISGGALVAIVLNLPTIGPLLYGSLMSQDMFLAGSTVIILSVLTIIGIFVSDMMLLWADPRIRFERKG